MVKGTSEPVRFSGTTRITSGIISAALCMITWSPIRISFSLIKSWLCNVTRLTFVPDTNTDSNSPVGVRTPVRPTLIVMSLRIVSTSSGGYLYAVAHLGSFAVLPSTSWSSKLLTLITIPSVSYGNSWRFSPQYSIASITSSIVLHTR